MIAGDRAPAWIHSPAVDLAFFAFPWVPFFAFYIFYVWVTGCEVCDISSFRRGFAGCGPLMLAIHLGTNGLLDIHRHYTFGIVYADPEERARRKSAYTWFPLLFVCAVIIPFGAYKYVPHEYSYAMRTAFLFIAAPEGVWTAFHGTTQKYGFLRAYSVKLGYGDPKLEKRMMLSWVLLLVTLAASAYRDELPAYISHWQRVDVRPLAPILQILRWFWIPTLAGSAYLTARWILQEIGYASKASLPKWIFALSTALMLATSFYSLIIGYMVFVVAHSIEYIAFVNISSSRKPGLKRWSGMPWISNFTIFSTVIILYALLAKHSAALAFGYTISAAYLHFIYDSMPWRFREPRTQELLMRMQSPHLFE